MLASVLIKCLGLTLYVLTLINLANVMTVQLDVVLTGLNDGVLIEYYGNDYIHVLTSGLSDAFSVDVFSGSSSEQYRGRVYMKLTKYVVNLTDTSFIVVLYSVSPYVINVSRVSSNNVLVDILKSPGNVSLQLMFRLVNNLSGVYGSQRIQIPPYLKAPLWNIAIIIASLIMFTATAVLDVRDYSQVKKDRWGIGESIALVVRYLTYGSLIAFLGAAIVTFGLAMYSSLVYYTFNFEVSWLLTPFLILVINAVTYYLCKWRGWYDVIDEE